jgi:hypothetical protein
VLLFKRIGDKVQLIRRNVHFRAKPGSPAAHAVETTYTDSVLLALHIKREHLKNLFTLVLGERPRNDFFFFVIFFGNQSSVPPDARSLARKHLRDIRKRIEETLANKHVAVDDTTRAHLEECRERIAKVLNASMQVQEP